MTPRAPSQRTGSGPVTRVEIDLSGCVNGVPTAVRGRGHFAGLEDGAGSRLDLELVAHVLPLQWDLLLALPCFLDPLLFVLARMPVAGRSERGAGEETSEIMRSGVRGLTDWCLVAGVECELGRATAVHSIRIQPGAVRLASQLRSARFELEVGEQVSAIAAERTFAPLPVGLEGCAMLSTGEVSTDRGRDCSYVTASRVSWPADALVFREVGGGAMVEVERAGWSEGGGRMMLTITTGAAEPETIGPAW